VGPRVEHLLVPAAGMLSHVIATMLDMPMVSHPTDLPVLEGLHTTSMKWGLPRGHADRAPRWGGGGDFDPPGGRLLAIFVIRPTELNRWLIASPFGEYPCFPGNPTLCFLSKQSCEAILSSWSSHRFHLG